MKYMERQAASLSARLSMVSGRLRGVSQALRSISRASFVTSAGLGVLAVAVGKVAKDFESSMTRAATVATGTATTFTSNFNKMSNEAIRLANVTQHTASQIGDGMNFMAMAGMKTTEVIAAMPTVAKLASAANLDIAKSADIVTNAMNSFGMTSAELQKASQRSTKTLLSQAEVTAALTEKTSAAANAMIGVFTNSNVSLTEMAESLKVAGSSAQQLRMPLREAAAAIGILGNTGMKGTESGTKLKRVMVAMVKPVGKAAETMKKFGISTKDMEGPGGLVRTVARLESVRNSMTRAGKSTLFLAKIFEMFGERGGPAMAAWVGQGAIAIQKLVHEAERAEDMDLASIIEERQLATLAGALDILVSNIQTLAKSLGDILLPELKETVKWLTEMTGELRNTDDRVKELAISGGKLAFVGGIFGAVGAKALSMGADVFDGSLRLQDAKAGWRRR